MRTAVIENFPAPAEAPKSVTDYLAEVDDIYKADAYHSLSIEGYQVTPELIEQVRDGNWNPDGNVSNREKINALAARGYWEAFQEVRRTVAKVLSGEESGQEAGTSHGKWYRSLFAPSVQAGIIKPQDLAGYRSMPVYIRQSKHTPPNAKAVRDVMPVLFDLLSEEESPQVRVVLGHFIFVYIHPYMDGNGRIGRFLMNLMMAALEKASVEGDIIPFARFLAGVLAGKKI